MSFKTLSFKHFASTPAVGRVIEAFAWTALVAAFIIGQIASQTDYEEMLKAQKPKFEFQRSQGSLHNLPVIYDVFQNDQKQDFVAIIAEGMAYGGPVVLAIKASRNETGGEISEIIVLRDKETPAFLAKVTESKFFQQFRRADVTNEFIIGEDIDAVTGATVTSEGFTAAVREAVHLGAVTQLGLEVTWKEKDWKFNSDELILTGLFILAFFAAYKRGMVAKVARYIVMIGSVAFIGFYANLSLSLGNIAGIFMGYIPSIKDHPMWWIIILGSLGSVILLGRNIYCTQLCPFSIVQDFINKISGVKLKMKAGFQKTARKIMLFLCWASLMLIFLSAHPALGSYEPFAMMFSLEGVGIQWYILPAVLLASMFIPSFWCRYFCPVGFYLNEGVRMHRSVRNRLFSKKSRSNRINVKMKDD